jgi:hypothetical protein
MRLLCALLTLCRHLAAIQRLEIAADRYRHKLLTAGFETRDKVIDSMPGFWPIALRNSAALLQLTAIEDDTKALQFLKKVKVWRNPEQIQAFGFEFVRFFDRRSWRQQADRLSLKTLSPQHFDTNPFFSNSILKNMFPLLTPKY